VAGGLFSDYDLGGFYDEAVDPGSA